jgi:phosphoenolpyruvate synthase/pyruvate phosphate dikinase
MQYTKPFQELGKNDAHLAGGKGASLGEMIQNGIPVPAGFVVLAQTFEKFLAETDLVQEIDTLLHEVDHNAIHTVEKASEKIQGLIESQTMPKEIQEEILANFKMLGAQYVAVRSSATAEDGAEHAWAGQLDSYLNTTEENLLQKVQQCWASLFTPRAIFYRFEKGLHGTAISVAVVIQKMVESEISGIAFSVHPVTEDYNQLIIEAGFGLGEAIVSGSVTPDSYVVEKNPRSILDINVSDQTRGLYRAEGSERSRGESNVWQELGAKGAEQKLSEEQILELSEIILRIERHYGFPCDIEWAAASKRSEGSELVEEQELKFYIVQSRPITTLTPKDPTSEDVTVSGMNTKFPEEGESSSFYSPALQDFNVDEWQYDGLWKNDLFATCFWQDCFVSEVVAELGIDLDRVGVMNLQGGHYLVHKPTRAIMDSQIKQMIDERNEAFFKNLVDVANRTFQWGVEKGEFLSMQESTLENFRDFVTTAKKLNFLWLIAATYTNWPVEEKLGEAVIEDKFPPEYVLDIIPTITTPLHHYQAGLGELKRKIGNKTFKEVQQDAEVFEALKQHAEKYVWVETFNFIGEAMTPEKLYGTISYLEEEGDVQQSFDSKDLSEKLRFVASCMYAAGYVKQGGAEYFLIFSRKAIPFLERVANKIGVTYREMMCLSTHEIDAALQGVFKPEELKQKAQERIGVNNWVLVGEKNGEIIFIDEPADIKILADTMIPRIGEGTRELAGQIGNRGKYSGRVCVVMNTYDFDKLEAGDVLVTTMTTPDFIILMQKSGAIVTDIGGLLCHAAIVSRELGVPCIIGTKFATQMLHDGDLVEVDADNGVVRILEKAYTAGLDEQEKSKNIETFKHDDWIVYFSGDKWMPLGFSSWVSLFTRAPFSENIDHFVSQAIMVWDGVSATSYIRESERKIFGEKVATLALKDTNFITSLCKDFRAGTDFALESYKKSGEITDIQKLQNFNQKFVDDYYRYHLQVKNVVDFLPKELVDKYLPILQEARLYAEPVFSQETDFVNEIAVFFAKKINYKTENVLFLFANELINHFEFGEPLPSEKILEERSKGCIIFFEESEIVNTISGDDASKHLSSLFAYDTNTSSVEGNTAYGGLVRGIVRIVADPDNIKQFDEGDILVAPWTRPEYLPIMKKARAFVTDGGGMLSHAAIMAREFKKPCIIGTKIATQVLKDGDFVEVDADNGVVRVLEKKNGNNGSSQNILTEKFSLEEWDLKFTRFRCPLIQSIIHFGWASYFSPVKTLLINAQVYTNKADEVLAKQAYLQKVKEYPQYHWDEVKKAYKEFQNFQTTALASLQQKNYSSDSIEELKQDFTLLTHWLHEWVLLTLVLPNFADQDLADNVRKGLQRYVDEKENQEEFEKLYQQFITTAKPGFLEDYQKKLLFLADRKIKNQLTLEEEQQALAELVVEYGWLGDTGRLVDTWGYKEVAEQLQQVIEQAPRQEVATEKLLEDSFSQLEADQALQDAVLLAREYVYFRTWRMDVVMLVTHRTKHLLEAIAKRLHISLRELSFLSAEEIYHALDGQSLPEDLVQRQEGFLALLENKSVAIYSGEVVQKTKESLTTTVIATSFSGTVAFKGKATGRVSIVYSEKDRAKFQKGNILVSPMTKPEIVTVMKLAGAIITDEGGITCHAAIMSRELRIPCIIGTKIATQVFKDGDLVEVDANSGVVRILEKAKPTEEKQFGLFVHDFNVPLNPWSVLVDVFNAYLPKLTNGQLPYLDNLFVYEKEEALWGPNEKQFAEAAEFFIQKLKKEPEFLNVIVSELEHAFAKTDDYVKGLVGKDLSQLSNKDLYTIFQEGCDLYSELWIWGMIGQFLEMGEVKMSDILKEKIRGVLKEFGDAETVFAQLMTPRQLSKIAEERIAVFELIKEIQKDTELLEMVTKVATFKELPKNIQEKIEAITKEYGWLQYYYVGPAATEEYHFNLFKENLHKDATQELQEKENVQKGLVTFQEEVEEKLSAEDRALTHQLRTIAYLKEVRKESQYFINYGLDGWYAEIAKRFNTSSLYCRYILPREYQQILEEEKEFPAIETLEDRYTLCAYVGIGGVDKLVTGQEARELKNSFRRAQKEEGDQELIKGSVAYPGKVTGRAKLVNAAKDMEKFQAGDILISNATTPVLVPAMNKAAAIVTDSGGVTCHAAIVSRELKIPCIVGTKVITQVVKDGDLVEVDADNGVVRVLEKAKEVAIPKLDSIVARKYIPFLTDLFMRSYANQEYCQKLFWHDGIMVRMGYVDGKYYYDKNFKVFAQQVLDNLKASNKTTVELFENIYSYGDSLLEHVYKIRDKKFKSKVELLSCFEEIILELEQFCNSLVGLGLQFPITDQLYSILPDNLQNDESIALLSFPEKENKALIEQKELYSIGARIQENQVSKYQTLPSHLKKVLEDHVTSFGWINARGGFIESWTSEELFSRIIQEKERFTGKLESLEHARQESSRKSKKLIKSLHLTQAEQQLIVDAKELVFFRTYRTDTINEAFFVLQPLMKQLAKFFGVSHEDILQVRFEEIISNNIPSQKVLEARKKNYFALADNWNTVLFADAEEDIRRSVEEYIEEEKFNNTALKGNTAYKGKVVGLARLILNTSDIAKVQKGEILVTAMTTPNMVPAMEKAAGFVTDEGGITCHAAIIAREMKKPCVIATKFATRVLKDGDLVEVDADNGVVRILEKKAD